jgi:MFS family permease
MLLATTSALAFLAFLNATVLNVAFPDLARTFGAGVDLLSWTVTAYGAAFAAGVITCGRLADAVGRRRVLTVGSAVFALASAGCALAVSPATLIAARAAQGLAAALITPASFSLLLSGMEENRRARAIAVWSAAAATSSFAGPPLGGLAVQLAGWRAPLALSFLLASCLLVFLGRLPESRDPDGRLPDVRGVLTAGVAVALLILATTQAGRWGWSDPRTVAGMATAVAALAAGVLGLGHRRWRAVDLTLFHSGAFTAANALSVPFGFAAFAWLLAAPMFAAGVWGWDALIAALSVLPGAIVAALSAWGAGRMPARRRVLAIVVGAVLFVGAMLFLIASLERSPQFLEIWLPAGILAGIGIGAVLAGLSAIVGTATPEARLAEGAGINMTVRQLAGTLGVAAVGALLGTGGQSDPTEYTAVWLTAAVAGLLTAGGGMTMLCRRELGSLPPTLSRRKWPARRPSATLER